MEYARQLRLVDELLYCGLDPNSAHADALCRITYAEHGHSLPRDE